MDEIRVLTRMGGKIADWVASDSSMAYAKRNATSIHAVATITGSPNGSTNTATSSSTYRNTFHSRTSIVWSTIRTDLHQRTGKADLRTAGTDVGVPAGNYQKKA
jgi:hypothetical protein